MDRKLAERLDRIEKAVTTIPPRVWYLQYRQEIPSGKVVRQTEYSPCNGTIQNALIQFPAGCMYLVEVKIYLGPRKIFPHTKEGIALDDAVKWFDIKVPVKKDDPIAVEWTNYDSDNPHTVPVVVSVVGYSGGEA